MSLSQRITNTPNIMPEIISSIYHGNLNIIHWLYSFSILSNAIIQIQCLEKYGVLKKYCLLSLVFISKPFVKIVKEVPQGIEFFQNYHPKYKYLIIET
jgi:hypothetical protein